MLSFRQLPKLGTPFSRDVHFNHLFEVSKATIISDIEDGVQIFNPNKLACLATDWSEKRIGLWMFQKCGFGARYLILRC